MSVLHDWRCMAHGEFEARGDPKKPPKCPRGCSSSLVELVFNRAPSFGSARFRKGDKLVRDMAEMQGLSDISTSPSRPGGSVADRNRKKGWSNRLRGPRGHEYPDFAKAVPVDFGKYIGAMTHRANELTNTGFGHKYEPSEWKKDKDTGAVKHVGAQGPIRPVPVGSTGVSIERVREKSE